MFQSKGLGVQRAPPAAASRQAVPGTGRAGITSAKQASRAVPARTHPRPGC